MNHVDNILDGKRAFWLLLVVACITIIPFLGLADFHTKGEPREAVVAYSMLESGNWILPTNNGGEIPYKPPFFHWGVAAASVLSGGEVTEFTSRLPSAIALIAMTLMVFVFYRENTLQTSPDGERGKGYATTAALLTGFVSLTAFELHRAGANCRVDMVLTALTVGALILFYRYWRRGLRGVPWLAILLMSCATLTKGPVGSLIPCLTFGVFLLAMGVNFFKAFGLLFAWGVASFILPLGWYYAAYLQGGDTFLDLVMEENFGRMTNTMSYDSCVNPWHYNFVTLLGGYVPWILLVILSLFTLRYLKALDSTVNLGVITRWWEKQRRSNPVGIFSAICICVIFLFYCFPQSKRSVYLMPIYPFIAYFLARYMMYLVSVKSWSVKAYGSILASLGVIITGIFLYLKTVGVPETLFHGRHAAQNIAMAQNIADISGVAWVFALLPLLAAAVWFWKIRKPLSTYTVYMVCLVTFGLYMGIDGAYQPRVLNAKSQRPEAEIINTIAPATTGTLYEYIEEAEVAAGDPVHFFELNFYLGDRIRSFSGDRPDSGYLLITEDDAERHLPAFEADGYRFELFYTTRRPILHRRPARLYRFTRQGKVKQ